MSKARNIADIGSHDVIETDADGVTITGGISSNDLTVAGNAIATAGSLSNRNKIINGAMVIDQRNAGVAVTVNSSGNFYVVDRFFATGQSTDGVFTAQQSSVAPAGFNKSLLATVTTADASIGATQQYLVAQAIEGLNVAELGWGSSDAQTVTLSFWVRSSLTGTFGGSLMNSAFDRSYPFSYAISSADTWEYKTVTVVGDTSGTWLTTNGVGIRLYFSLGAGSTYVGTAGSWNGSFLVGVTGQTNLIATNGATFYLTGVQLEAGDTATPFEHRSYGQELALCQRYFQKIGEVLGRYVMSGVILNQPTRAAFPTLVTEMRATPTIVTRNNGTGAVGELREFSSNVARTVTAIYSVTLVGGGYAQMNTTLNQSLEIVAEYSAEL